MDKRLIQVDFSTKYWYLFKRSFPSPLRVHSADFIPEKQQWISAVFKYPSFSFILQGSGELRHQGCSYPVVAPCLLVEWPGDLFEYGPAPGEKWTEFYIKYEAECFSALLDCGFIDRRKPLRPLQHLQNVESLIRKLAELANARELFHQVDWVDRLCEQIILTALTPERFQESLRETDVFKKMENFIQTGLHPDISLQELARQFHMSPQTFRRRCHETHQMSPVRYLTRLRIEEGSRLLLETVLTVSEIACRTGFKDAHYFSRRFRQEMGKSPSEFRRGSPYT